MRLMRRASLHNRFTNNYKAQLLRNKKKLLMNFIEKFRYVS